MAKEDELKLSEREEQTIFDALPEWKKRLLMQKKS